MKCQILFSKKNKKKSPVCCLLSAHSVVMLNRSKMYISLHNMGDVKSQGVFESVRNAQIQIHPTHAQDLTSAFVLH